MIPKKRRINKRVFQLVMKNSRVFHSPLFSLFYLESKEPQYSFVVPQKILKNAVKRNKYRRRGYNIIKNFNNIKNGTGIFFYKKEALGLGFIETKKGVEDILKKAKII